jgi:hypothetical protein
VNEARYDNHQQAPWPAELEELIDKLKYKPGWRFWLDSLDRGQSCVGLTLTIAIRCPNSYDHETNIAVRHLFPVPPAAFNEGSWRRWLFNQIVKVETHEAMEFFTVDDVKPYAPHHGPGEDPYVVWERGTDEAARTSNIGVVK